MNFNARARLSASNLYAALRFPAIAAVRPPHGLSMDGFMADMIMIALILGLFALGIGYAYACEGL